MFGTGPSLDKVRIDTLHEGFLRKPLEYPFSLSVLQNVEEISFSGKVTFFVGENGSGKSTLLESIALKAGYGREGGSKNINFSTSDESHLVHVDSLSAAMTLSWRKKPKDGYFFRAESFFNIATHIDTIAREHDAYASYKPYGGKSLHAQSHGESFLSFFRNRLGMGGFYIFDEPEAALSPQRQLSLLRIMYEVCQKPDSQFIIATHSPLILAYPGATIYTCDEGSLRTIEYKKTKHFEITKGFLDNPDLYLRHLFSDY